MSDATQQPTTESVDVGEARDAWPVLSIEERVEALRLLPRSDAEDLFLELGAAGQAEVLLGLPASERRSWIRLLAPDDAADLIQAAPRSDREELMALLDAQTRGEVQALLAYKDDIAGGLMSPRYARVRPEMTVDQAISYLRKQAREQLETIYYAYVLDDEQRLIGTVSFRQLFKANAAALVRDIMKTDLVTVAEDMDQESVGRIFKQQDFLALPVVGRDGQMKGIVTGDDIVDVVEEEATEDIHKIGGTQALDAPYMDVDILTMVKKRAVWLAVLFVGEMLTATAMSFFEHQISRVVVLALFVPLIISSGGNAGSQASTLVIRAMALGEVRIQEWWRVMRREFFAGLFLGIILAVIGFSRVVAWELAFGSYGEAYLAIATVVGGSLVGVVLFGSLAGSMLPFLLRRAGLDPASASAPFIATLVDVTGLLIYFGLASVLLASSLE